MLHLFDFCKRAAPALLFSCVIATSSVVACEIDNHTFLMDYNQPESMSGNECEQDYECLSARLVHGLGSLRDRYIDSYDQDATRYKRFYVEAISGVASIELLAGDLDASVLAITEIVKTDMPALQLTNYVDRWFQSLDFFCGREITTEVIKEVFGLLGYREYLQSKISLLENFRTGLRISQSAINTLEDQEATLDRLDREDTVLRLVRSGRADLIAIFFEKMQSRGYSRLNLRETSHYVSLSRSVTAAKRMLEYMEWYGYRYKVDHVLNPLDYFSNQDGHNIENSFDYMLARAVLLGTIEYGN